jgi:predicted  nucleic acid-binding Zn-ribbon protein
MYAREVEYFHYEFDAKNFEHLIDNAPIGADTKDLQERLESTRKQMMAVDNTYKALESQITDLAEHEAAVIRTTKKREEDEIRSDK